MTLKNFKSHRDRQFEFQPGTNAICGENGAGKTSILEAIGWTLFDYIGDYNKDDLVRNGASSGQARVVFLSNRDGRTYEAQRCTSRGYTLFDPQLNQRLPYTLIKEEVLPWLRQHLGVSPGTDLAKLFASTIGIPQGTFTADFLLTATNRKPIFDKILKVEEYREVYKKLAHLNKHAEMLVEVLKQDIARYTEELQEFEVVFEQRQVQSQEIDRVQTALQQAQAQVTQLQVEQDQLTTQAVQLEQVEIQIQRCTDRLQTQTQQLDRLQTDYTQAEQAVTLCTHHRDAYQTFLQAEKALQELEQHRLTEQQLQRSQRQQEKQLSDRQLQLQTVTLQLEDLAQATATIAQLKPLVQQQTDLEQTQQDLAQQLQQCRDRRQTLKVQEKQLAETRSRQAQVEKGIARLQPLQTSVQQIPDLEQQQQRYQQQLSQTAAAKQFEAELQQLFTQAQTQGDRYLTQVQQTEATLRTLQQAVPQWTETLEAAVTTLYTGRHWQQNFLFSLEELLQDLAEQAVGSKLEQQLQKVQMQLQTARLHQSDVANLPRLLDDRRELDSALQDLQTTLTMLHTELEVEPSLQQQQTQLTATLADLNDPRGQSRLLQQKLQQQPQLQTQVQTMQAAVAETEAAIAQLHQQLATFADLTVEIQSQQKLREQHRAAYEAYLSHRELANLHKERYERWQTAIAQRQTLEQELQQARETSDRLRQSFDPVQFQAVQIAYQNAKDQCIALTASLPDKQRMLENLDRQLEKLRSTQAKRDQAELDLTQKRKIEKFVKFARKVYDDASKRIPERYVQRISSEADRLFRELLNRPNVGLEWTKDYEILVQEGAHTRRLINLSGGEQMCAALAVRLALLKVLADIDIAFFDEPTTNMDRPRREHLAAAIANIKTFRQLFVISHDDTFEKVTENIIFIEREA